MSIGAEKVVMAKIVSLAVLSFAIPVSGAVKGMALVPGGKFEMGSFELMDSGPVHHVELDSFYIDVTEVTVGALSRLRQGRRQGNARSAGLGLENRPSDGQRHLGGRSELLLRSRQEAAHRGGVGKSGPRNRLPHFPMVGR